jgi:hypothetical protein
MSSPASPPSLCLLVTGAWIGLGLLDTLYAGCVRWPEPRAGLPSRRRLGGDRHRAGHELPHVAGREDGGQLPGGAWVAALAISSASRTRLTVRTFQSRTSHRLVRVPARRQMHR